MLLKITMPHEPFNSAAKEGTAGLKMKKIMDATKPEAVYFTALGGKRTVLLIADLPDSSGIPALAEPWFLTFQADVGFHPVMSPGDLQKGGLEELGKAWG